MSSGGGGLFGSIPILGPVMHTLFLPLNQSLEQIDTAKNYKFNRAQPMVIPPLDTLIECYLRRVGEGDEQFKVKWIDMAMQYHGINLGQTWPDLEGDEIATAEAIRCGFHTWRNAFALKQAVPGISEILDARRRELVDNGTARRLLRRSGADVDRMLASIEWARERPGMSDILDALARDRIGPDEARQLSIEAGSNLDLWDALLPSRWQRFGPGELVALRNRGVIGDAEFTDRLKRDGWGESLDRGMWDELRKGLPQVADLTMMGIREAFRPELAQVYDYYAEFPELTRPWFEKLGLNYPTGIQVQAAGVPREATLADLYWASHWHPMPLGQAYLAYQRFQPDLLARFKEDNPNLKAFTLDDLKLHMRIADLPPGVRDWMVALSHPVFGMRQIAQSGESLGWDRAEMQARYRLLGYTTDDAASLARLAEARANAKEAAWKASILRRAHTTTVSEIEGLYDDGIIDRGQALSQLSASGLSDVLSIHLLDLSDSRRARGLLREAVTATGRDYLSGALSVGEATQALADLGIKSARAGELMQIWSVRRSHRRKRADTSKILHWVSVGAMTADEARRRLANLGWTDPDLVLLTAEAGSNLDKLRTREIKAADREAHARAREVERLAREARAEHQRLITAANRIAPRSTLIKWLKDGVIDQDEFRAQMRVREYPDTAIEEYLRDALSPRPKKPPVVPAHQAFPKPAGSAHPSLGLLQKWYLTEVISPDEFREGLTELGYGPDDVERLVRGAELSHGAKGTTDSPPSPPA